MKLLTVKVECNHELEDGLGSFMQDELDTQGIESRERSDFVAEDQKHDSSLVELDDVENLPKDLELAAYFNYENADKRELVKKVTDKVTEMKGYGSNTGEVLISTEEMTNEDWNMAWQKYYRVIDFSRHLTIVPEWEDYHPAFSDQKLIRLDPGLAFGTDGHTITQLVLLTMGRALVKPMSILDIGTRSGILAIAASKLGASHALGTDISDEAVTVARENIALNGVSNISVHRANLLRDIDDEYDLTVANILADTLLELIPNLDGHLNEEGEVVFSGIDYLQLPKVERALAENSFEVRMKVQEGHWIGLLVARKPD